LYILGVLNGGQTERRQQTPAAYSQAAKDDAQRSCIGRDPGALFECIYEKVEASKEQATTEQDLSAQQRAADSALASAVIALLTLAITGYGVWLVKGTLDATLEAVEDTSEATAEMRRSNDIAFNAQRPWVAVNCTLTKFERKSRHLTAEFVVSFKNIGQTIARDCHCSAHVNIVDAKTRDPISAIMRRFDNGKSSRDGPADPMIPGDVNDIKIRSNFAFFGGEADLTEFRPPSAVVAAMAYYRSSPSGEWHETEISFIVSGPDQFDMVIQPSIPEGLNDENTIHVRRYVAGSIS
jgi:hypothetical protein